MSGEKKTQLMTGYGTATGAFADAVTKLEHEMGTLSQAEYDRRAQAVNEAQIKSEEARLAVERHVGMHRCWRLLFALRAIWRRGPIPLAGPQRHLADTGWPSSDPS
jgi:hypothetical protein